MTNEEHTNYLTFVDEVVEMIGGLLPSVYKDAEPFITYPFKEPNLILVELFRKEKGNAFPWLIKDSENFRQGYDIYMASLASLALYYYYKELGPKARIYNGVVVYLSTYLANAISPRTPKATYDEELEIGKELIDRIIPNKSSLHRLILDTGFNNLSTDTSIETKCLLDANSTYYCLSKAGGRVMLIDTILELKQLVNEEIKKSLTTEMLFKMEKDSLIEVKTYTKEAGRLREKHFSSYIKEMQEVINTTSLNKRG